MRAIDTNVLVRLITRDDEKQVAAAESVVKEGAWVSHLVLMETAWVLMSVYDVDAMHVAAAMEMLLEHEHLVLEAPATVRAALLTFHARPQLGFSDCLIYEVARRSGHIPVTTFDRGLAKLVDTERI